MVNLTTASLEGLSSCTLRGTGNRWVNYTTPTGTAPQDCYNSTTPAATAGGGALGTTSAATAPGHWSPFRGTTPSATSAPFHGTTAGTATAGAATTTSSATTVTETEDWTSSVAPGLQPVLSLPRTPLQVEFTTGLTPVSDNYLDVLNYSDRALTKDYYWVACGESDFLQLRDLHTFDLHLNFFKRANLTLGDRATETVYVIGLRLEANKLHDFFLDSKIGLFNRLYTEYYLTLYTGLELNTEEAAATLALRSHWSYASWTVRTASHFKHAQLLWDGVPPAPHWMPAAVDWQNRDLSTETEGTSSSSTGSDSNKLADLLRLVSEIMKK